MSLARRRMDINSLTNPPDDEWRRERKWDSDGAEESSTSSSPASPKHAPLWGWPRIANPHPSLLAAADPAPRHKDPVPPRTRSAAPVPVEGLTKKSRGRRVPTADGDIVLPKDGEKMTRMFACTVDGCGKCFHRGEHLKRHIRSIHTNERPHSCPEPDCFKTFSRHDNLIQHMKTHGRTLAMLLPAAATSRESLDSRQAQPHTAYRYYPGPMANMPPSRSGSRSSPALHAETDPEPESEDDARAKPDAMDVDSDLRTRSATSSGTHTPALGRPKATHLPVVFQPTMVDVGVNTVTPSPPPRVRQSHERGLGSPQGELHCPHAPCGKTFRRGEHLRRHIKGIHLAERPHACPHPGCGKTFSRHDNLMQHAKRHSRTVDNRKSAGRKRTQSAQSATTEGDEPEFESEDEC